MHHSDDGLLATAYRAQEEYDNWKPRIQRETLNDLQMMHKVKGRCKCTGDCPECGGDCTVFATHYDLYFYYEQCENCKYLNKKRFTSNAQMEWITNEKIKNKKLVDDL